MSTQSLQTISFLLHASIGRTSRSISWKQHCRKPAKTPSRYSISMRSLSDDLLSQHSMFIDLSTVRYERGCRRMGDSKNGLNTLSHGYSGYFQTKITVIEVSGGDCFRTHGMFYCIPRGTTMRRGWILHGSVLWLCTVMVNTKQPKSCRWK
jgi:hypothetical protein